MQFARASGVLLHLTSLPGRFGVGDLGAEAYRFVDFLVEAKQSLWQILPLGPTSNGNLHSPYVALSAFAGNPLLISLESLVSDDGLLSEAGLNNLTTLPEGVANYEAANDGKLAALHTAAEKFFSEASAEQHAAFAEFCDRRRWWIDDYAFFMALREAFHETAWTTWEPGLVRRAQSALHTWGERLAQEIRFHKFLQFLFFTQWERLKTYANQRGVKLIGDLPIYVGFDSAEVWAHPELFDLHPQTRLPRCVAGVPPDYFSKTGQRWGNPLYRWRDEHDQPVQAVYDWWVERFRATFELVDIVRVDHFRGFEAYWAIPAKEKTAIKGQWRRGPGASLFRIVQETLGELPVIAEDLGLITPEVNELRLQCGFPGMKVLQFAFSGEADNIYLPHNYADPHCIVYTGTHDNDTTLGWFRTAAPDCQAYTLRYLGRSADINLPWEMIRLAWSSVAAWAVAPLQDVLGLSSDGRMNIPGKPQGNWQWRYLPGALHDQLSAGLAELTHLYGRKIA